MESVAGKPLRTVRLRTGRPVMTGTVARVELLADLVEVAAAAAMAVTARVPLVGAARIAAKRAARIAAVDGAARVAAAGVWPSHGLSLLLLQELAPLPVSVHQVQAVNLELVLGFLRDGLHVPFQQASKIMNDLLVVGVGLGAGH